MANYNIAYKPSINQESLYEIMLRYLLESVCNAMIEICISLLGNQLLNTLRETLHFFIMQCIDV